MRGLAHRSLAPCLAAALAALVLASTASAGEFDQFKQCPLAKHEVNDCLYTVTNGGSLELGEKTISLVNPITLQGGYVGGGPETQFRGAENGDTLSKTPQPVPGGLLGQTAPPSWPKGVQDWFNELIETGFTGVTATIELAASATSIGLNTENLLLEEGTALKLPAKIKLSNPILGSNCYVGSNAEPIPLELTTGTSGSLSGSLGEISFNEEFTIITISSLKLVDGTFSAPEAEGCGGIYAQYVDPFVDSLFGIPAGTGENSLTMKGTLKDANAEAVTAAFM